MNGGRTFHDPDIRFKVKKQIVSFNYGLFGDTLEKQANEQGLTFGKNAKTIEKYKKATITLRFFLAMPESMYDKILKRFNQRLTKFLKLKT